jgi:hypothetical protein
MSLSSMFSRLRGQPKKVTVALEAGDLPEGYVRSPRYGSPIFASFGDYIVCDSPEQHEIGMFVRLVKRGEDSAAIQRDVAWLQHPIPEIGCDIATIACKVCGARWAGPYMHLHFRDGWR